VLWDDVAIAGQRLLHDETITSRDQLAAALITELGIDAKNHKATKVVNDCTLTLWQSLARKSADRGSSSVGVYRSAILPG
jgi:hypothetical protein